MNFFAELPAQAKALIGGLLLLFVLAVGANFIPRGGGTGGGAVTAGGDAAPSGYTVLFHHMEPKDAGDAAGVLKEKYIPFEIVEDGTALAVPQDKADEARIRLAERGIPKEGVVGFAELFPSGPNMLSTDFEKRLAFNRALNGELSRLVRKIDGVEAASVIVNMPEERLFTEERKPTTSSVMVRLAPNRSLGKQQIEGIQHLVASSVPGLKTNNVEVVSDQGKLLTDGLAENSGDVEDRLAAKALDRQMMLTHERERGIEEKVQSLLDKVFGAGNSVVRVAAELDFTQRKTKQILYAPPADASGRTFPTSRQTFLERTGGGASAQGGGLPGTTSNLPRVPTYPLEQVAPQVGNGAGGTFRQSESVQNAGQMSTNLTLTQDEIGAVKRLSITALIKGLLPERVPATIQIVASAAGADVARRGDQVVVQSVAFDDSQQNMLKQLLEQQSQAQQQAAAQRKKDGGIPTNWIIGVGAAFVALFLVLLLLRMANRKEDTTDVLVSSLGEPGMPSAFDPNALQGYPGADMGAMEGGMDDTDPRFAFLREHDPGTIAQLLMELRPPLIAGVLRKLDEGTANAVFEYLPEEVSGEVAERYNGELPPEFQLNSAANQLKRAAQSLVGA